MDFSVLKETVSERGETPYCGSRGDQAPKHEELRVRGTDGYFPRGQKGSEHRGVRWAVKGVLTVRQDPFGAASPEADLRRGAGQRLAERRTEVPSP